MKIIPNPLRHLEATGRLILIWTPKTEVTDFEYESEDEGELDTLPP